MRGGTWSLTRRGARTRGAYRVLGEQGQRVGKKDACHRAQAEGRDAEHDALLELDVPQCGQRLCGHDADGQAGPAGVVVGMIEEAALERGGVEHREIPSDHLVPSGKHKMP